MGEAAALVDDQVGEVAGRDHPHVRGRRAQLVDHPGDDPLDLGGDAEDHPGLEGLDGVLGDHRARPGQLDLAQLGTTTAERLEGELDAGS